VRVLVTGGAGFIGSHVVDRLLADGHQIDVVDNLGTGRRDFVSAKATCHCCDVRSARLDEVFAAAEPEAVVHVAAQAAVARSTATTLEVGLALTMAYFKAGQTVST
jgi:UDP-glucose 4-epimerase